MTDVRRRAKILIVDDSLTFRNILSAELSKEKDFEVVAFASDPYEARQKMIIYDPDVMILDIILPKMDGVEFVGRLMEECPIPVVVISSVGEYINMAVRAGAIDGVMKPQGGGEFGISNFVRQISEKIRRACYLNRGVMNRAGLTGSAGQTGYAGSAGQTGYAGSVRQASRAGSAGSAGRAGSAWHAEPAGSAWHAEPAGHSGHTEPAGHASSAFIRKTNIDLIVIGASTGGTNAIADIMAELPAGLPGIVIVQHMPADFTDMFAKRLNSTCAMSVCEARSGDRILPGTALVAPGSFHLRVVKSGDAYSALVQAGDKVNGHCPSVDVMFMSVAEIAGSRAIGVLLTGMGNDGAKGLLEMKKSGAKTIGQDKNSSVVYGMPKVAYDIGAVAYQLPLNQIAAQIVTLS